MLVPSISVQEWNLFRPKTNERQTPPAPPTHQSQAYILASFQPFNFAAPAIPAPRRCPDLLGTAWYYGYNTYDPYRTSMECPAPVGPQEFVPMHWCVDGLNASIPSYVNTTFMLGSAPVPTCQIFRIYGRLCPVEAWSGWAHPMLPISTYALLQRPNFLNWWDKFVAGRSTGVPEFPGLLHRAGVTGDKLRDGWWLRFGASVGGALGSSINDEQDSGITGVDSFASTGIWNGIQIKTPSAPEYLDSFEIENTPSTDILTCSDVTE
eukprot:gene2045-3031_t